MSIKLLDRREIDWADAALGDRSLLSQKAADLPDANENAWATRERVLDRRIARLLEGDVITEEQATTLRALSAQEKYAAVEIVSEAPVGLVDVSLFDGRQLEFTGNFTRRNLDKFADDFMRISRLNGALSESEAEVLYAKSAKERFATAYALVESLKA